MLHDLVVIGAGPAGVAGARRARELGASVAIVRPPHPRVTGSATARVLAATFAAAPRAAGGGGYGVALRLRTGLRLDVLRARAARISTWEAARSDASLQELGVSLVDGSASFRGPERLTVSDRGSLAVLSASRTLIAVGARWARPATVPFDGRSIVSADEVLSLDNVPTRLTIVGAGELGCLLAGAFAALGSRVFLVEQAASVRSFDLPFREQVELYTSTRALCVRREADGSLVTLLEGQPPIVSRGVIWAAGMRGATERLGLERVGLVADSRGLLTVDGRCRTLRPDVFAAGRVVEGWLPDAAAASAGRRAAEAALGCDADDLPQPLAGEA